MSDVKKDKQNCENCIFAVNCNDCTGCFCGPCCYCTIASKCNNQRQITDNFVSKEGYKNEKS